MHSRHLRPFAAAVALVLLASAAWWLLLPQMPFSQQTKRLQRAVEPPSDGATDSASASPRALPSPRVGKEMLAETVPEQEPNLALPGKLPAIDGEIAPPAPEPEPPVEDLQTQGQVHPSAGQEAARVAWPIVRRCAGSWQGLLRLEFGMAGGEVAGSSRYWEPKASGSTPEVATCIVRELADVLVAAPTDANGSVRVVYRLGQVPLRNR